jgi:hypothetical protein
LSTELHLAQTSRISTDDYDKPILLGPKETRTVSWFVTVDKELEKGYSYTFPIIVYTNDNQRYTTEFKSKSGSTSYTKEELGYMQQAVTSTALTCEYETQIPQGDEFVVKCENQGERVCIQDKCSQDTVTYTQKYSEAGVKTLQATSGSSQRFITVLVQDKANISTEISAPQTILFGQNASIEVTLTPTSQSTPKHVVATLTHPLFTQEFSVESLSNVQKVQIPLATQHMLSGKNTFTLTTNYGTSETITVFVESTSFSNKLTLWLNSLSAWVNALF